jgi:hypothetical protein
MLEAGKRRGKEQATWNECKDMVRHSNFERDRTARKHEGDTASIRLWNHISTRTARIYCVNRKLRALCP